MLPLLRRRYGLPTANLEEVMMCERKYWSWLVQQRMTDEYPPFGLVDPEHDTRPPEGLRYLMWVKPVKSFSSELAIGVADDDAFRAALRRIREGLGWVGEPFDVWLEHVDLPPEIAAAGGHLPGGGGDPRSAAHGLPLPGRGGRLRGGGLGEPQEQSSFLR